MALLAAPCSGDDPHAGRQAPALAFRADGSGSLVVVHCAVAAPAKLVMSLTAGGRTRLVVARASDHAGLGVLTWNRRFGAASSPKGRYRLTVTATISGPRSVRIRSRCGGRR